MGSEEKEKLQSGSDEQKPNQEQQAPALKKQLNRTKPPTNAFIDHIPDYIFTEPMFEKLLNEKLRGYSSVDPQVMALFLYLFKSLQKSSSLTKDETKALVADALSEAIKASDALKPKPGDVVKIAETQLNIIEGYYESVLKQAQRSFIAALIAASIGLVFFIAAVSFLLVERSASVSIVSLIAGSLVEVISGINFYLYARASDQLSTFHLRLDRTQNFLLANSVCENIEGDTKQQTRAKLVDTIANSLGIPVSGDKGVT